ncbi:MAG TPA: YggS family pyridoxal phosphate-dependent enzyme [Pyrinomonadaceae bacterium]|nr:YggS family pyridoxal phosphate-dependent enzyme [Pyrinomonadaceae bacterium]
MKSEARQEFLSLRARAGEVRSRIEASAARADRDPREITLVAVSKTRPSSLIREAAATGLSEFGENRVQEAEGKIEELKSERENLHWHLIGHLQANKARRAARLFDMIHSVDSVSLVEKLERACSEDGRGRLDVLLQIDLAGEETKSGASEDELHALVESLNGCSRVRCRGLMTLPPFFEDAELVRPYFRRLRSLRDELRARGVFGESPGDLSMGMTHDFEVAVEEGATILRVGTAIFGERGRHGI